jgi:hypothetical protein
MSACTRLIAVVLLLAALTACTSVSSRENTSVTTVVPTSPLQSDQKYSDEVASQACPLSEPIWAKPPQDSAVQGPAAFGYYIVNADRSMWASAWWTEREDYPLRASKQGVKLGWFRPAGVALEITGHRIDAQAAPLEAHIPCCYPTRFQATGLYFPSEGCWEVIAKADQSELTFVVWVEA